MRVRETYHNGVCDSAYSKQHATKCIPVCDPCAGDGHGVQRKLNLTSILKHPQIPDYQKTNMKHILREAFETTIVFVQAFGARNPHISGTVFAKPDAFQTIIQRRAVVKNCGLGAPIVLYEPVQRRYHVLGGPFNWLHTCLWVCAPCGWLVGEPKVLREPCAKPDCRDAPRESVSSPSTHSDKLRLIATEEPPARSE